MRVAKGRAVPHLISRSKDILAVCPACGHEQSIGAWVAAHLDIETQGPCRNCGIMTCIKPNTRIVYERPEELQCPENG